MKYKRRKQENNFVFIDTGRNIRKSEVGLIHLYSPFATKLWSTQMYEKIVKRITENSFFNDQTCHMSSETAGLNCRLSCACVCVCSDEILAQCDSRKVSSPHTHPPAALKQTAPGIVVLF